MANGFTPTNAAGYISLATSMKNGLTPAMATKYKIDPLEVGIIGSIATNLPLLFGFIEIVKTYGESVTKWKEELLFGVEDGALPAEPPAVLTPPAIPVGASDMIGFLLSIAGRIKATNGYSKADGELLGIEAPASAPVDWNTAKGKITGTTVLLEKVILEWLKWKSQGVNIYRSRDGVAFTLLGRDSKSPFEDSEHNLTSASEYRWYKVRFLHDDQEVGEFSDVVKVVVDIH